MSHWDLIECDLADRGIDFGDDELMARRSWRWLRARILGLLTAPPVALEPFSGTVLYGTRLQAVITPPPDTQQQSEEG